MLRIGSRGGDPRDQDNSQQAGNSSTSSRQAGHATRVGAHIHPAQEAAEVVPNGGADPPRPHPNLVPPTLAWGFSAR